MKSTSFNGTPQVTTRACDVLQLTNFLQGELRADAERDLTEHLEECSACRERLDELAAERGLWDEAEVLLKPETFGTEKESRQPLQIQHVLDALGPTDDPAMLGRLGGLEVSGVVGTGAMGVVLKGIDRSLDRTVAIKVMAPHLASHGSARKRFAREAKAAAAVLHPNVMAIHSVSNDESLPYLVMPYVGGTSLQKRLDDNGPLPVDEVLRIGSQIAHGLQAAHAQGLVHRDIKPANIMLEEGVERVAITDFGLARAVDDATMTRSGAIAGTPQYMSPEQASGESVDQRSDLFSLGSVLYTMCTGRPPFRAETSFGILRRITDTQPRPIREINPDVPHWLCQIIEKLMAKRPEDRFASAGEVAELLEECLAHVQQPATVPLPQKCSTDSLPVSGQAGSLCYDVQPDRAPRKPWANALRLMIGAAFVFALVFAGILIVLETNKGTLTIESEADHVPIRITQGDKVVEKLTVSESGASVRVAAGEYVVEIEGEADGITIENDTISIERAGRAVVRIVQRNVPATKPDDQQLSDFEHAHHGLQIETRKCTDCHAGWDKAHEGLLLRDKLHFNKCTDCHTRFDSLNGFARAADNVPGTVASPEASVDEQKALPSLNASGIDLVASPRDRQAVANACNEFLSALREDRHRDAVQLLSKEHEERLNERSWQTETKRLLPEKTVFTDAFISGGGALVLSQSLTFTKPLPDVGDSGRLLMALQQEEGRWCVQDVGFWSNEAVNKLLTVMQMQVADAISRHKVRIRSQLEKQITPRFDRTSLRDFADYIARETGIKVILDEQGMAAVGVMDIDRVTLVVEQPIRASRALDLVLEPLRLRYEIRGGYLRITGTETEGQEALGTGETIGTEADRPARIAGTTARTPLMDAIHKFNQQQQQDPVGKEQPPLTEDEVIAAIRAASLDPIPPEHFIAFEKIAEAGRWPPGWRLDSERNIKLAAGGEVDAWSVVLIGPKGIAWFAPAPTYPIRERALRYWPGAPEKEFDDSAEERRGLRELVDEFNKRLAESGPRLPPLTVNEVVAAMRLHLERQTDSPGEAVTKELETIATTSTVADGSNLELRTGYQAGGFEFTTIDCLLRIPASEAGGTSYALTIRKRFLATKKAPQLPEQSNAKQVESVSFIQRVTSVDKTSFELKGYLHGDQLRWEMPNGIICVENTKERKGIFLDKAKKEAARYDIPKDMGPQSRWQTNPVEWLRTIKTNDAQSLGQELLDGEKVAVFSATNPGLFTERTESESYGFFPERNVKIWVDKKTQLPLMIEIREPQGSETVTFSKMKWNEPLERHLFRRDIPNGFTEVDAQSFRLRLPVPHTGVRHSTIDERRQLLDRIEQGLQALPPDGQQTAEQSKQFRDLILARDAYRKALKQRDNLDSPLELRDLKRLQGSWSAMSAVVYKDGEPKELIRNTAPSDSQWRTMTIRGQSLEGIPHAPSKEGLAFPSYAIAHAATIMVDARAKGEFMLVGEEPITMVVVPKSSDGVGKPARRRFYLFRFLDDGSLELATDPSRPEIAPRSFTSDGCVVLRFQRIPSEEEKSK